MRSLPVMVIGAVFSAGVVLAPGFLHAGSDEVKIDRGDIVWAQSDGVRPQIYFTSFSSAANTWSAPVKVTDDAYKNGHPTIDAGADGTKLMAWVAGSGTNYMIHCAIGTGGTWSQTAAIPSTMKVNLAPSAMVDASGGKWVAWAANNGGQDEIYYSRYIGNAWTAPALVNAANDVPDVLPEMSLNAGNVPQVSWIGFRNGAYVKLQSTWTGDSWSPAAQVQADAVSEEQTTQENASIVNMPSFIEHPNKAFVRVYKYSSVK